jgi:hypothetical protein
LINKTTTTTTTTTRNKLLLAYQMLTLQFIHAGKEFSQRNVDKLLADIKSWEELGEKLSLPKSRLNEIDTDLCYKGMNRKRSAMVDLWFRFDTGASWKKLSDALHEMDERVLAEKIRKEYVPFILFYNTSASEVFHSS